MMRHEMTEEPPAVMKGRGRPVMGRRPLTPAMLRKAWNSMSTVRLPARKLDCRLRSRASWEMRRPQ